MLCMIHFYGGKRPIFQMDDDPFPAENGCTVSVCMSTIVYFRWLHADVKLKCFIYYVHKYVHIFDLWGQVFNAFNKQIQAHL